MIFLFRIRDLVLTVYNSIKEYKIEGIMMICVDKNIQQCSPSIDSMSIDYKKQLMITNIKLGMQILICYILSKKCKNLCKIWPRGIYESTCV